MIELTLDRFDESLRTDLSFAQPLVVGAKRHDRLLMDMLPNVKKILEPVGRNSAPAIAAACLTYQPDDLILVLPADHDIQDVQAFHDAISIAAKATQSGSIVTFGIEPTHPATDYGYLKTSGENRMGELRSVEEFVEKPNHEMAQSYLESGIYLWNAGIFLFKASVMLDALRSHAPDVLSGTRRAMVGQSGNSISLDAAKFSATPSISIDYAVLERFENIKTVPVKMGWSDVGGYRSLHQLLTRAHIQNYTSGPVHIQNSTGSYVRSEGPAVSINGVSNLIVVATPDEVMITPMNKGSAVKNLRHEVQSGRRALGFPPELRMQMRDWLWEAFETWAQNGWDERRGGFVEQLTMNGAPDTLATRRVRVQARQVFSFSKAIEIGWPNADRANALVDAGIRYIDTKLRHPGGGWVHTVNAEGSTIDQKRDLYDHAFIIIAGSAAYRATGSQRALKIADDAITFIDKELKDHHSGGWFEAQPAVLPRRANPHMHLLEAMLAYYHATGCEEALKRASEIVRLFETRFFQPATDIMAEYFAQDWQLTSSQDETRFEPGHHYEWATLLSEYEAVTKHDTGSWRRRLIRRADSSSVVSNTNFVANQMNAQGDVINNGSRLWHQLERFRSYLIHPGEQSSVSSDKLFRDIFDTYLSRGPKGGWVDEIDPTGNPVSCAVPASMLFHLVTAFESILPAIQEEERFASTG